MRSTFPRLLLRPLAWLWALPTTLLGLLLAALSLASGGRALLIAGALEVSGGCATFLLRRLSPFAGAVEALTLGHVVVGRNAEALARWREHERAHVRQCERWGPLFVPAYLCASLAAWARGADPYLDNPFERAARGEGPRAGRSQRP
jgi:hypothetical protein